MPELKTIETIGEFESELPVDLTVHVNEVKKIIPAGRTIDDYDVIQRRENVVIDGKQVTRVHLIFVPIPRPEDFLYGEALNLRLKQLCEAKRKGVFVDWRGWYLTSFARSALGYPEYDFLGEAQHRPKLPFLEEPE